MNVVLILELTLLMSSHCYFLWYCHMYEQCIVYYLTEILNSCICMSIYLSTGIRMALSDVIASITISFGNYIGSGTSVSNTV